MSIPFSSDQFEDPKKPIRTMPIRRVRVNRLDATQVSYDMNKVKAMASPDAGVTNKVPIVASKADGRLAVLDGHHRAAAALLKGDDYINVRIAKR